MPTLTFQLPLVDQDVRLLWFIDREAERLDGVKPRPQDDWAVKESVSTVERIVAPGEWLTDKELLTYYGPKAFDGRDGLRRMRKWGRAKDSYRIILRKKLHAKDGGELAPAIGNYFILPMPCSLPHYASLKAWAVDEFTGEETLLTP